MSAPPKTPEDVGAAILAFVSSVTGPVADPDRPGESFDFYWTTDWKADYGENCAAVLFVPAGLSAYESWKSAVAMRSIAMTRLERRKLAQQSGWTKAASAADLFVPRENLHQGNWRWCTGEAPTRGLDHLLADDRPVFTVQVKMRLEYLGAGDYPDRWDAIPYGYFVDLTAATGMGRNEFLADPPWRRPAVDLFVTVLAGVDPTDGKLRPRARLLAADDARQAILGREVALRGVQREVTGWGSRKVSFRQIFGGEANLPPVGMDMTDVLAGVPRPCM